MHCFQYIDFSGLRTSRATPNRSVPIYHVTVVQRSLQAVNFERHSGPTEIDLKGTLLLPKAEGKATVEVKNGYTRIDLNLKHLEAAYAVRRRNS